MRERRARHIDISVKTYNKSVGSTFVHHTMHPLAAVLWPLQQHLIFLQKTPCTQGEKDPVWGCECERQINGEKARKRERERDSGRDRERERKRKREREKERVATNIIYI